VTQGLLFGKTVTDLEGMMLSTQNVTYEETVSTSSFKLLEGVKRLFQIVVSKHT